MKDIDKFVEMYKSGMPSTQISNETGFKPQVILYHLHKKGVRIRHGADAQAHRRKITPEQEDEIVKRFMNGESSDDLAEAFGVSDSTIMKYVHKNVDNIGHRYIKKLSLDQIQDICDRFLDGESVSKIHRDYEFVTREAVRGILKRRDMI